MFFMHSFYTVTNIPCSRYSQNDLQAKDAQWITEIPCQSTNSCEVKLFTLYKVVYIHTVKKKMLILILVSPWDIFYMSLRRSLNFKLN